MTLNPNELLQTEALDNSVWVAANGTVTVGQADPNAGTAAANFTATAADATLAQTVAVSEAGNRTFSVYLKRISGSGDVSLSLEGTAFSTVTLSGSWVRFNINGLVAAGNAAVTLKLAVSGDVVAVAFPQYEFGDITDYLPNVANRYTVTQIVDPDYPTNTARGCAYMDGRFFVMTPLGEIYQSELENVLAWGALDFIQSQADPSKGVYLAKVQNYLMALKDQSIEFFYDAANSTGSILAPVQNASTQIGCAHEDSVKEFAGTVIWMGHTREGLGRAIYRLEGTSPVKISTPQIDQILTGDALTGVYSWCAAVGSHALYGITLVDTGVTLVYDFSTDWWVEFTYLTLSGTAKTVTAIDNTGTVTATGHGYAEGDIVLVSGTGTVYDGWWVAGDVSTNTFQLPSLGVSYTGTASAQKYIESYFPISTSVRCNGKQYMQHATSGVLYEFSQSAYTDVVGAIAARVRTPKFDADDVAYRTISEVEVVGDKVESYAALRYSDDDFATFSPVRSVDLGAERSRSRRCGRFARRAFEVLHVADTALRLEALEITVK